MKKWINESSVTRVLFYEAMTKKEVMMTLELFLWLTGFAFTVVFGVGAMVFWINNITNKRIDDTNKKIDDLKTEIKDLFTAKLEPLQKQVENHLPSQIKELKTEMHVLKANQEKILKILEKMDQ